MKEKINKKKYLNETLGFFAHNWFSIIFMLIVVPLFVCYLINNPQRHLINFTDNYVTEIAFSIITSVLIISYITLQKYLQDLKILKLLEGYWAVYKNDGEFYYQEQTTVLISRTNDLKVMKFEMEEAATLNDFKGFLYINDNNKKIGKLLYKFNFFQNIIVDGPLCEYSYFIDEDYYSSEYERIIRIINMQGKEIMVLKKPCEQNKYINSYMKLKSYYSEKKGHNNMSDVAQKILENYHLRNQQ